VGTKFCGRLGTSYNTVGNTEADFFIVTCLASKNCMIKGMRSHVRPFFWVSKPKGNCARALNEFKKIKKMKKLRCKNLMELLKINIA
jgi:hypothetical protein